MFGQNSCCLVERNIVVILSTAAWQGDDMQAETRTVTVAQLLFARHYWLNAGQIGP